MEIKLTNKNFEEEILKGKGWALVDFFATWCGPCRMVGPILEEIAKENDDIKIGKINVDEENALSAKYGVMSIPTMILFKDGKEIDQILGYHSKEEILEFINSRK